MNHCLAKIKGDFTFIQFLANFCVYLGITNLKISIVGHF